MAERSLHFFSGFWAIFLREIRVFATSAIGYVVLTLFLLISGFFFGASTLQFASASMAGTYQNMIVLLLFLTPVITMRLLSEEKKLGTVELLMTKPVTDTSVVLGKFAAAVVYVMALLLPIAVYASILYRYGNPDTGPLLSGVVGVLLIAIAFLSLGVFASSLTENQVIAAVLTFVFLLLFWAIDFLSGSLGTSETGLLTYISLRTHINDLLRGVIDVKDILYYISFSIFWVFAAIKVFGSRRW